MEVHSRQGNSMTHGDTKQYPAYIGVYLVQVSILSLYNVITWASALHSYLSGLFSILHPNICDINILS